MKAISILIITVLFSGASLFAQSIERSVIAVLGASAEAGDLQLEYTAGEAVISTLSDGDLTITQGFHQGTLQTTGLRGLPLSVSYKIYPNPVTTELWLNLEGSDLDLQVAIYNAAGQPVGTFRKIKAAGHWKESFDLSRQTPGAYLVVIMDERGTWLQSHKVLKL
ncbi:T9SS type A sorting domain-containing protein [Flavilitoribacter nigricans]|nr:T9SS type A sorting domain-containing protein [Flavilitoribacter nigricans]